MLSPALVFSRFVKISGEISHARLSGRGSLVTAFSGLEKKQPSVLFASEDTREYGIMVLKIAKLTALKMDASGRAERRCFRQKRRIK
jgi:hypothetical protein